MIEPRVPKLTSMSVFKPSLSFKSPCLIFSLPPSVGEISLFAHISLFSVEKNKHVLYRWNRIKYINSNPMNSQIEISFFAPKIFHPKSRQNFPDFSGRQQLLQILGFQTQLPRIGAVQGLHISSETGRAVVDFYEETGLLYPLVMSK